MGRPQGMTQNVILCKKLKSSVCNEAVFSNSNLDRVEGYASGEIMTIAFVSF